MCFLLKVPIKMECGHKPICLECFKKDDKCPECGQKLMGNRDKFIAEVAGPIKKAIEEENEKKRIETMTAEKKTELDKIKEMDNEIEEETKGVNAQVEESGEKLKEKQNEVDACDRDMDETKRKLEDVDNENMAILRSMYRNTEMEKVKGKEYEEAKAKQKMIEDKKENIIKEVQEDDEKREKLNARMEEIQAGIQAYEKREEQQEIVKLGMSFIGKADKMFDDIEEEKERKAQQSTGAWIVSETIEYVKSLWPWGGGSKDRDPETVLESYDFFEELGNEHSGLFRARLKKDDDGKNFIVRKVELSKRIESDRSALKGMNSEDLSKFVEPYILYLSNSLETNEIVKISKYIIPEYSSTLSSSYQWSRSTLRKSVSEYSYFYRYQLKTFSNSESIDLEYLSKAGRINPAVHGPSILKQLLKALAYLNSLKIVHRDINPVNIFLSGELTDSECPISLAGFSQAVSLTEDAIFVPLKTPTRFHPPECFRNDVISWPKVDLWSVGCTVAEVCMGGKPLFTVPELRTMTPSDEEVVERRLEGMDMVGEVCKRFVKIFLSLDPSKRTKASKCLLVLSPDTKVVLCEKPVPFDRDTLEHFVGSLFSHKNLPEK